MSPETPYLVAALVVDIIVFVLSMVMVVVFNHKDRVIRHESSFSETVGGFFGFWSVIFGVMIFIVTIQFVAHDVVVWIASLF